MAKCRFQVLSLTRVRAPQDYTSTISLTKAVKTQLISCLAACSDRPRLSSTIPSMTLLPQSLAGKHWNSPRLETSTYGFVHSILTGELKGHRRTSRPGYARNLALRHLILT